MSNYLAEKSLLMRFTAGLPGQSRKDKKTTSDVKNEKGLGDSAGKWVTDLWPGGALDAIKTKQTEARAYHDKVTFPFGVRPDSDEAGEGKATAINGVGILPAVLIVEYTDTMRRFCSEYQRLADDFLTNPRQWVDWAIGAHNGTFNPKNYPGCSRSADGKIEFDEAAFRKVMGKKFYMRSEPLPIPHAEQFTAQVAAMIGADAESVNLRVQDAGIEAQRELMRRLIGPVKAMAAKLAEEPKPGKDSPIFRDTLVENIREIADLAPKLNLAGDPQIDAFSKELLVELAAIEPDSLRKSQGNRLAVAQRADEIAKRMESYRL